VEAIRATPEREGMALVAREELRIIEESIGNGRDELSLGD
jgi:hypothetical protein